MPPRPFKIKRELLPAVGDENVALLKRNLLAAAVDPSLAVDVHAGGVQVNASACDLHACMCSTNSAAADLRDSKVSDYSRLDRAVQGLFAGRLDAHRRDVTTDKICPEIRTLPR